jgi:hypothetical protein
MEVSREVRSGDMDSRDESPQDPSSAERAVAALAEPYIPEPLLCEVRPRRAPGLLRRGGRNRPDPWSILAITVVAAFFSGLAPLGVTRALAPYFAYAHFLPWLAVPFAGWVIVRLAIGVYADPALPNYIGGTPQPALVMLSRWRPLPEDDEDPAYYEAVVTTLTKNPRTNLIEPRAFASRPVSAGLLEHTTITVHMWDKVTVLYLDDGEPYFTLYGLTELDPQVRFVRVASGWPWMKWVFFDLLGTALLWVIAAILIAFRTPMVVKVPSSIAAVVVVGTAIGLTEFFVRRRVEQGMRDRRARVKRAMMSGGGPLLPDRREEAPRAVGRILQCASTGLVGGWALLVGLNTIGDFAPATPIVVQVEEVRDATFLACHRFTLRFKDPESGKSRVTPLTYDEFQAVATSARAELTAKRGVFGWRWVERVSPAAP